jgi:hypothetical protein
MKARCTRAFFYLYRVPAEFSIPDKLTGIFQFYFVFQYSGVRPLTRVCGLHSKNQLFDCNFKGDCVIAGNIIGGFDCQVLSCL